MMMLTTSHNHDNNDNNNAMDFYYHHQDFGYYGDFTKCRDNVDIPITTRCFWHSFQYPKSTNGETE